MNNDRNAKLMILEIPLIVIFLYPVDVSAIGLSADGLSGANEGLIKDEELPPDSRLNNILKCNLISM